MKTRVEVLLHLCPVLKALVGLYQRVSKKEQPLGFHLALTASWETREWWRLFRCCTLVLLTRGIAMVQNSSRSK